MFGDAWSRKVNKSKHCCLQISLLISHETWWHSSLFNRWSFYPLLPFSPFLFLDFSIHFLSLASSLLLPFFLFLLIKNNPIVIGKWKSQCCSVEVSLVLTAFLVFAMWKWWDSWMKIFLRAWGLSSLLYPCANTVEHNGHFSYKLQ